MGPEIVMEYSQSGAATKTQSRVNCVRKAWDKLPENLRRGSPGYYNGQFILGKLGESCGKPKETCKKM